MSKTSRVTASDGVSGACTVLIVLLAINLFLGGFAVQYVLVNAFGLHPAFAPCVIAGLFLGEVALPAAVIVWIVALCGAHVPFWHLAMMAQFIGIQF